jgi:hypothetical protein
VDPEVGQPKRLFDQVLDEGDAPERRMSFPASNHRKSDPGIAATLCIGRR